MKDKFVCSDHGRKPSQSYNLTLDPCSSYNLRLKPIYVDEQQTNTFITAELKPIKNEGKLRHSTIMRYNLTQSY